MRLPSLFGLTGCALLLASLVLALLHARRLPVIPRAGLLLGTVLVAFLPIGGLPLTGYVRGLIGDFSITTCILLGAYCGSQVLDRDAYHPRSLSLLLLLASAAGLVLYPFALGLTYFDPYTLGYDSRLFLTGVFCLALWAVYREHYLVAVCLTAGVLAHSLGVLESRNLWDHLLDPWLTLYALGTTAVAAVRSKC